jgi:uncharacterized protein YggU (UPF0235/DUF167 family)
VADTLPETLAVRVIPRARRDQVGGERDGRLVVRTVAPPADGKANVAVTKLLAAHLGIPARRLELVAGHTSRDKVFRITN